MPTSVQRSDDGFLLELKSSASKIIICQEENVERVLGIKSQCDIEHIIVTSNAGYDLEEVSLPLPPGAHDLRRLLAEY
ncbi:MAG: hypothetical protein E4H27_10725, partial [Anaerolineales bacterium]